MAKITISNSPDGYNLADFSLTVLLDYFYWQHTSTSTVFTSVQNNDGTGFDPSVTGVYRMEVLGTGLTDALAPTFVYTGGTINIFNYLLDGTQLITATELDLSATAITNALIEALGSNGTIDNTLALILQNADSITGGTGADTLGGMGGNDSVLGGAGSDSLLGGDGNDLLKGQKGNDRLFGDDGNDTLSGSDGADLLTGGDGADVFLFDAKLKANVDAIADFSVADDQIHLENAIFTKIGKLGTLKAGAYVEGLKAKDGGDRIIYDQSTGRLWYDADGNGKGKAMLFANVAGGTDLTNGDFLIV
jgi:Ca2+-binding RTX toxin-like protein